MTARLAAIVPVKNLANVKQRLAPALSPDERQGLFASMLEDVLSVLVQVRTLDRVCLVTRDPQASALAARLGARVLEEPENRGHTEAVQFGADAAAAAGLDGIITIPADVPLITPDEVERVVAAHGDAPAITIVPSHDELGSNAVACSPPHALVFRFGDNSFFPHLERARASGVEPQVVQCEGIALDVDTPADLARFLSEPSATLAYEYARKSGILDRLMRDSFHTNDPSGAA